MAGPMSWIITASRTPMPPGDPGTRKPAVHDTANSRTISSRLISGCWNSSAASSSTTAPSTTKEKAIRPATLMAVSSRGSASSWPRPSLRLRPGSRRLTTCTARKGAISMVTATAAR